MCTYRRHRLPPDIIFHAVWLYYRFNLSHRDIEDLRQRGIIVTRESIRLWYPPKVGALGEALAALIPNKAGQALGQALHQVRSYIRQKTETEASRIQRHLLH